MPLIAQLGDGILGSGKFVVMNWPTREKWLGRQDSNLQ
jgi:hypothetical protein